MSLRFDAGGSSLENNSQNGVCAARRLACVLLMFSMCLAGCSDEPTPATQNTTTQTTSTPPALDGQQQQTGDADAAGGASEITLTSADQAKLAEVIAEQRGQVVLVDFWATWCGPCLEKFPSIVKLHEKHRDIGLVLITVSTDAPDLRSKVLDTLTQLKSHSAINLHASMEVGVFDAFELTAVPEYRVYDRLGELQATYQIDPSAARPFTVDDIEAKVKELLEQSGN